MHFFLCKLMGFFSVRNSWNLSVQDVKSRKTFVSVFDHKVEQMLSKTSWKIPTKRNHIFTWQPNAFCPIQKSERMKSDSHTHTHTVAAIATQGIIIIILDYLIFRFFTCHFIRISNLMNIMWFHLHLHCLFGCEPECVLVLQWHLLLFDYDANEMLFAHSIRR